MRLTASCQLNFEAQALLPLILMLRPRSGASQTVITDQWQLKPDMSAIEYVDLYGNACYRLLVPAGNLQIISTVTVDTSDAIDVNPKS